MRVRIGVGEKPKGYDLADFVLSHFSQDEKEAVYSGMIRAANAIEMSFLFFIGFLLYLSFVKSPVAAVFTIAVQTSFVLSASFPLKWRHSMVRSSNCGASFTNSATA